MSGPAVRVAASPSEVATLAADVVQEQIRAKPNAVLALPTGRTPLPLYDELAARYRAGRIDFSRTRVFNLDEWVGVPPEALGSYARFMEDYFYSRVNVRPENRHIQNGMADDLEAECRRYEALIREAGGLDLAVLGIGRNGHIGFNEPSDLEVAEALRLPTRLVELHPVTRTDAASREFGSEENVIPRALTMGVATILAARSILILATGAHKAEAVAAALDGPMTAAIPASLLQSAAPRVTWILDEAAARGLPRHR